MGTSIGAKDACASENGIMNSLWSVLKMRIKTTGACMGVLASM